MFSKKYLFPNFILFFAENHIEKNTGFAHVSCDLVFVASEKFKYLNIV